MNKSTKELFYAPWTVKHHVHACWEVDFEISTVDRMRVAVSPTEETANRLSRMPELYDALVEAVNDACQDCVDETYERTGFLFDPANDGCVYPERDCCPKCRSWIALLRKVRDAK